VALRRQSHSLLIHGASTGCKVSHDDFACEIKAEANTNARRAHVLRAKAPYGFLNHSEKLMRHASYGIAKPYHNGSCYDKCQGCEIEHVNEIVAETEGVFERLEVGVAYTIASWLVSLCYLIDRERPYQPCLQLWMCRTMLS
jgi:hypothetical protein